MKPILWHARITTYSGISAGAIHWYLKVTSHLREIEVYWTLDARRAAEMTKREHPSFTWRAGNRTNRFDTIAQARTAGRLVFSWVDTGTGLLVAGDHSGPARPLAGPPNLMVDAWAFYDEAVTAGWYEGDYAAMADVDNRWHEWERATFEPAPLQWRSGDTSREEFVITGPLEDPTGVWYSASGEPEPDEDVELPEDERPRPGLIPPGLSR